MGGEIPTFLSFKPEDPEVFQEKQLKELKNGRLAMIAVLGELMAQQVSGYGTYEQLSIISRTCPSSLPTRLASFPSKRTHGQVNSEASTRVTLFRCVGRVDVAKGCPIHTPA